MFIHFHHSNVSSNKSNKQKRLVLFFYTHQTSSACAGVCAHASNGYDCHILTLILFTTSRFLGNEKKYFLKIEYLESLLKLALMKICRTVFSWNYMIFSILLQKPWAVLRVFANVAVFSTNRKCRISTGSTCSKENLI